VRKFLEKIVFLPTFSHFVLKMGELFAHFLEKNRKIWVKIQNFPSVELALDYFDPVC